MKDKEREKEKKAYERWTEIREKGKKREWADERWKMDENEEERNPKKWGMIKKFVGHILLPFLYVCN